MRTLRYVDRTLTTQTTLNLTVEICVIRVICVLLIYLTSYLRKLTNPKTKNRIQKKTINMMSTQI